MNANTTSSCLTASHSYPRCRATIFWSVMALLMTFTASSLSAVDLPPGKCSAMEPIGLDFRIASESTTFDKRRPDTATSANGNSIVVWESFGTNLGTDHDRYSVQARRLDEDGSPLGTQFQVNTVSVDEQRSPSVATAPGGRFVIVWRSGKDASGLKEIRGRVFAANGAPQGSDFKINTIAPNGAQNSRQTRPQVAMTASGRFLVTWASDGSPGSDNDNTSIQARLFSASGSPLGAQFQLNQTTTSAQTRPDVAARTDGSFLVTWESLRSSGTDNSSQSVQARAVTTDGAPLGAEFQVNTFTQSSQTRPSVASGVGGQSLIVWQSRGSAGSDQDRESIQAQAISADNSLLGPEFQVNQNVADSQLVPRVAAGPAGDYLVVWQSDTSSGGDHGNRSIQARHIASPGRFFDLEFQVNTTTQADQETPAVSVGPNNATVTYYSDAFNGRLEFESLVQVLEGMISPNSLCLKDRRFLVQVDWKNFQGGTGKGSVIPGGSADSGLFWFFQPANWEMLVKVIDGCGLNNKFWVFAAATTDVEYNLRVTDLFTGEQIEYNNPLGNAAAAITDAGAFATCDVTAAQWDPEENPSSRTVNVVDLSNPLTALPRTPLENQPAKDWIPGWSTPDSFQATTLGPSEDLVVSTESLCAPGSESLCLQANRFKISVDYRTLQGTTGNAQRVPFGSPDSGLFWFFNADNWEMLVKVIDGCGLNDRYWVFAAATTDVEYTLRVRDTETGQEVNYFNPLNTAAAAINDTSAFATCP